MKKTNVAQFWINDRFQLSLSDAFTKGVGFEAVIIDHKSSDDKSKFIDLPEVWGFRDLKKTMKRAIEKINEIIAQEVLENTEFLEF